MTRYRQVTRCRRSLPLKAKHSHQQEVGVRLSAANFRLVWTRKWTKIQGELPAAPSHVRKKKRTSQRNTSARTSQSRAPGAQQYIHTFNLQHYKSRVSNIFLSALKVNLWGGRRVQNSERVVLTSMDVLVALHDALVT